MLVIVFAVAAAIGGIAAVKTGARVRGKLERDPRRVAAACRKELAGFLLDQGFTSDGNATVRELGDVAQRRLGVDARPFVAAATAARYGRIEQAPDAARETRRELARLLESCRKLLTRPDRVRGLLSLRSLSRARVTGDWTAHTGSWSA